MTTNENIDGVDRFFTNAFFDALVEALSEASGSLWIVAPAPDTDSALDSSESVRIKLSVAGSLRGEAQLECDLETASMLISRFHRQPNGEIGNDQSKPLITLVESAMSKFCAALAQDCGEVTITVSAASGEAPDRTNICRATIADDDDNRALILMYLNPPLIESLSMVQKKKRGTVGCIEGPASSDAGGALSEPVNLNLVMDVELNVTLRFGQRQLTLREVLELTTGSVVELDRQVEEPIELLLEGKVIARGEAVVIDGNYGLRVTEVCQPIFSPSTS